MDARIYCRVSTQEQAQEGFSISAQRRACRQFCRSQGWTIADEYLDEGYSAKDTDRPALQRLLEDVSRDDIVVVWRLDRLTRSVLDLHQLLQRLETTGALFRSVTEPYDTTTAIGRLFVTLVAALAQWERENLGERVREGMTEAIRQGNWQGGPRPYGYRPENGKLLVEPAEAAIVRDMFQAYCNGHGLIAIATMLNERGLKTQNGARWAQFTVGYILRNPVYTGRLAFKKVKPQGTRKPRTPEAMVLSDVVNEPIVDDETFEKAQALMKHRKVGKVRTRGNIYPLSGVLFCGKCGGRMSGKCYTDDRSHPSRKRYYYGCQNRFRLKTCDRALAPQAQVERAFLHATRALSDRKTLETMLAARRPPVNQDLDAVRRELRSIAQKKARWYDAFESGAISLEDLKERTESLVAREADLQKQLSEAQDAETSTIHLEDLVEALSSLPSLWHDMIPQERKVWVHELYESVTLHLDGTVTVIPK